MIEEEAPDAVMPSLSNVFWRFWLGFPEDIVDIKEEEEEEEEEEERGGEAGVKDGGVGGEFVEGEGESVAFSMNSVCDIDLTDLFDFWG